MSHLFIFTMPGMESVQERSERLLAANVSAERGKDSWGRRYIIVRGQYTKAHYAVATNDWRVVLIEPFTSFCVKARGALPLADHALAVALYIQHDERHFLKQAVTASIHRGYAWHCLRAGVMSFTLFLWFAYVLIGSMIVVAMLSALLKLAL